MLLVFAFVYFVLTAKAVMAFDAIILAVSQRYRPRWIEFGSPPGFLRSPDGSQWLAGAMDRQRMVTRLAFFPPKWMLEDPAIRKARREYMVCWALLMLTVITAGLTIFANR
jgi:hypothetical protein